MHSPSKHNIIDRWRRIRHTDSYHNVALFLLFVVLAAMFWLIMAMNDKASRTFDLRLRIVNAPDTVTFITMPPENIHVTLQDKGTVLFRSGIMRHPTIDINFPNYAANGRMRFSSADLTAAIKAKFGNTVTIASANPDSVNIRYTTEHGKRVPIQIVTDLQSAFGFVIGSPLKASAAYVTLYSADINLDTITRVRTSPVIKRNLSENTTVTLPIRTVPGVRAIPDNIRLYIPVEPLVRKQTIIDVTVDNVPPTEDILLFPAKIQVEYFVPMNRFDSQDLGFQIHADYRQIQNHASRRLHTRITHRPSYAVNPTLQTDSVEYTIIKKIP